jgi:Baseplate J-like protein
MATLFTKSYSILLSDFASAVQGSASALLNFVVGTVLRALSQATASVVMWLQGLILQLLTVTRLATSSNGDVDTFLADFGFSRLPAQDATGQVVFSRATPTIATAVPVGAVVTSGDGTQSFVVIADPTNAAFNAGFNSYPLLVGVASVSVTVQAVHGCTGGNVSGGAISILQTGLPGVDTVTNPNAFISGVNAETDAAVKVRFQNFLASLFNATEQALIFAIDSVNQNLQVQLVEQPNGSPNVLLYVDDGTGSISSTLVNTASVAANSVRAAGITIGVLAATKLTAKVQMTLTTAAGFTHNTVVGQVATAVTNFINAIGLPPTVGGPAGTLFYLQLSAIAFGVPGVIGVDNMLLNGGAVDLVPAQGQTIKAGTVAVS